MMSRVGEAVRADVYRIDGPVGASGLRQRFFAERGCLFRALVSMGDGLGEGAARTLESGRKFAKMLGWQSPNKWGAPRDVMDVQNINTHAFL